MEEITRYKKEHIDFLRGRESESWTETTKAFNEKFNTNKTKQTLMWLASSNNIKKNFFKYNEEHEIWVRKNNSGVSFKELTVKFNKHFNSNVSYESFRAFAGRKKIKNGYITKFEKGRTPWNAGIKGLHLGGNAGWFKKGQKSQNHREVGSVRINSQGYTYVKTAEPSKWEAKHLLIWEEKFGKVPKGHNVIFADRNKQNFDLDNLILVNKKQLLKLNTNGYISNDKDLTKAGLNVVNLEIAIRDRGKKNEKKNLCNV